MASIFGLVLFLTILSSAHSGINFPLFDNSQLSAAYLTKFDQLRATEDDFNQISNVKGILRQSGMLIDKTEFQHWSGADRNNIVQYASYYDNSNISIECQRDLNLTTEALNDTENMANNTWAFKMIDATFKISSGFLEGSLSFPGSYDQCKSIRTQTFRGNYCLATLKLKAQGTNTRGLPFPFRFGLCVPSSCTADDLTHILNDNFTITMPNSPIPGLPDSIAEIGTLSFPGGCEKDGDFDNFEEIEIICFAIIGSVILVVLLATIYDIILEIKHSSVNKSFPNQRKIARAKPGIALQVFLAFSAYTNGRKVFRIGKNDESNLNCVHGIRVLSLTWVICGHGYGSFIYSHMRNFSSAFEVFKEFWFMIIGNATFSVDTFFMLSGLLVSYTFMRYAKHWTWFSILPFYIHRYIRLTPALGFMILISVGVLGKVITGPDRRSTEFINSMPCRNYWWTNVIYMNNFFPEKEPDAKAETCLGVSWYLANDMQFFVAAPFILYPLYRLPALGSILLLAATVASCLTNGVITYMNQYGMSLFEQGEGGGAGDQFQTIYVKPYTRAGPYLVGMLIGYLIFKKRNIHLHPFVIMIGWITSFIVMYANLYGPFHIYAGKHKPSFVESVAYMSLSRTSWSLATGWMVYACVVGYGGFINTFLSWRAFVPLSRLSYCCYLTHITIQELFFSSRQTQWYFSHKLALLMVVGFFVACYTLAFFFSICFEAPFIVIDNILLGNARKKPAENKASQNDTNKTIDIQNKRF